MRSVVFLLVALTASASFGQCFGGKCFGRPETVQASASVVEYPVLNRTVAESRVVHQEPIFDGHVIQVAGQLVSHVVHPQQCCRRVQPIEQCPQPSQPCQQVQQQPCNCRREVSAQASVSYSGGGLQAQAQAEADYMASHRIRGHVGATLGSFEGVGWSTGSNPPTCEPKRGMSLAADAVSCNHTGCYRVRAWQ